MSDRLSEHLRLTFLAWLATLGTACCFLPTISNQGYVFQAAFMVAILSGLAVGLRLLHAPAIVTLLLQLVVLAELIVIGFGDDRAWGILPTATTVDGLRAEISTGFEVAEMYAAPTPESSGLTLLVLLSICIVGAVVDFLAVGVHRVPLTGLPLLTLYTVPVTALPDGVPIYGFLPGAAAYIALLLADERDRLSHWGRLIARTPHDNENARMDTSGLLASGRRISVLAVASAVFMPIFIPAFSSAWFDQGSGSGSGPGNGGDISFEDPMVSLAQSLRRPDKVDVLEVRSAARPEYLRMAVLDQPGADNWSTTDVDLDNTIGLDNQLPVPTGLPSEALGPVQQMEISPAAEFPDDSTWLPVPFSVRGVEIDGSWAYVPKDQTVTATSTTAGSELGDYSATFTEVELTPEQLEASGAAPDDIADVFAEVPAGVPDAVRSVGRAITAGAANDYERALLLQSFFRDRTQFTYDVDAAYGYGYDAMEEFLQERRGFCQQFSATMAMMARTLGIPSRVVVGFLQPDRITADETYVITSDDVHAWPELYFDGLGWVRFEPTPGVGASLPSYAPRFDPGTSNPSVTPTAQPSDDIASRNPNADAPSEAPDTNDGASGSGGGTPPTRWIVLVTLIALLMVPALLRHGVRRSRLRRPVGHDDAAESAWLELRDHVRDLRLPWTGSMTPRAREQSVAELLPGDTTGRTALRRLALSVERSRYAAAALPGADPAADAVEVMGAIDRTSERGQRLRAVFLPTSLLPDLRAAWDGLREQMPRRGRGHETR